MATTFENNIRKPNFESVYRCKRSGEKRQGFSIYIYALYSARTWTLRQVDQIYPETFEMW